ncbi:MAG: Hsp20/alpha crystallin family protein [Thermodesulfobacteriota bacterium]
MAFVKWDHLGDPFINLLNIQDRMDRFFDEALSITEGDRDDLTRGTWSPAVDIYETDENIILKAELPGIARDDVDLEVKDNIMLLKGERKFNKDIKEENYHRMERSYGGFYRSFTLPNIIDKQGVRAKFSNGVLEVILPKDKKTSPKHIKVEVQ